MVVEVASRSIQGLRSGNKGYTKVANRNDTELLIGSQNKFVQKIVSQIKPMEPQFLTTIFFDPVPKNTKISVDNMYVGIGSNSLIRVEFTKSYVLKTGATLYDPVHEVTGYGSLSGEQLSSDLTFFEGKTVTSLALGEEGEYATREVEEVRPSLTINPNISKIITGTFVIGGEKEPL